MSLIWGFIKLCCKSFPTTQSFAKDYYTVRIQHTFSVNVSHFDSENFDHNFLESVPQISICLFGLELSSTRLEFFPQQKHLEARQHLRSSYFWVAGVFFLRLSFDQIQLKKKGELTASYPKVLTVQKMIGVFSERWSLFEMFVFWEEGYNPPTARHWK